MKKKSGPKSGPTLVAQKHGGALLTGGMPGNKGGTGRPPNALRELARQEMERHDLIPHLAILGKTAQREGDQITAITALARMAIPQQVDVGENPESPLLTPDQRQARLKALLDGR